MTDHDDPAGLGQRTRAVRRVRRRCPRRRRAGPVRGAPPGLPRLPDRGGDASARRPPHSRSTRSSRPPGCAPRCWPASSRSGRCRRSSSPTGGRSPTGSAAGRGTRRPVRSSSRRRWCSSRWSPPSRCDRGHPTTQGSVRRPSRSWQADDRQDFEQEFPDGSSATVAVSRSEGRAVIITEDMALAPEGKVYELWFQDPAG